MRNITTIVLSILDQTARLCNDPDEAHEIAKGRIRALSGATDALTGTAQPSSLRRLIKTATNPVAGHDQIKISGMDAPINPSAAVPLTLVMHELATNALKYGALSTDNGKIRITWSTQGQPGYKRLCLQWEESGGPLVSIPDRRGFGTRLIGYSDFRVGTDSTKNHPGSVVSG